MPRYPNPLYPMEHLRKEVDRLLSAFSGALPAGPWSAAGRGELAVNVWEKSDALLVELEVPGLKAEQLELSVVGNQLSLKVDRPENQEEGVTYHRRERPVGTLSRLIRLPVEVDADNVQADLRNGVLTITLPKAEAARPRKIHVGPGQ